MATLLAARGQALPLLEDTFRPFCAPSRLGVAGPLTARDLLSQPLIRSRDNDVSWEAWFAQRGITLEPWAVNHLQIDPSYVAIEAAVKGVGVILESSLLTAEHVVAGPASCTRGGAGAPGGVLLAVATARWRPQRNSHRLRVAAWPRELQS